MACKTEHRALLAIGSPEIGDTTAVHSLELEAERGQTCADHSEATCIVWCDGGALDQLFGELANGAVHSGSVIHVQFGIQGDSRLIGQTFDLAGDRVTAEQQITLPS